MKTNLLITKRIMSVLTIASCTAIMFACNPKEEEQVNPNAIPVQQANDNDPEYKTSKDGKIVLGKKLENP